MPCKPEDLIAVELFELLDETCAKLSRLTNGVDRDSVQNKSVMLIVCDNFNPR